MDYLLVCAVVFTCFVIYIFLKTVKKDLVSPNPTNLPAKVTSNPSPEDEYELIQFDEAMFTSGTTSQRFQERVGRYIHNGYRIHTMNVSVKKGFFVEQKQTYTVLFEKLPQPMSEGAAMLNS